jgi:hypothetical protein
VLKYFSVTPPENSVVAENSTENSGAHARIFLGYMYKLSQRHPVWVADAGISITWASGRGLGPGNLEIFGPQMALGYRFNAISQGPKNS